MPFDLIRLIHEGVITVDDLEEFSEDLRDTVKFLLERVKKETLDSKNTIII